MAAAQYAWQHGEFTGVCFRRTHTEHVLPGALTDRAMEWWVPQGAVWNGSKMLFTFPSGAKIAARESTVTPLSLPLQRPADPMNRSEPARRAVLSVCYRLRSRLMVVDGLKWLALKKWISFVSFQPTRVWTF